jgi:capsular exopolysaccharide synthesis family protein
METIKTTELTKLKVHVAEAYKSLRTNIQFFSMDKNIRIIAVTSACPGEGKTTVALNLAITLAQSGYKTIMLDCDQRKSRIYKKFGVEHGPGLSNYLMEESKICEVIYQVEIDSKLRENLYILPAGAKLSYPSELMGSNKMKDFIAVLKKDFEYIIIDTPSLLKVTDARILSQYADGCLLVISAGENSRELIIKAKELLDKVNVKILGAVLNNFKVSRKERNYEHY